ncbi:MAG: SoxR reducing system RseC family protein [Thermodesulfobacteriota bacterium]|nr:SoxR reducing system RseC family protein [Thermodesulfobacteriota bacterium]
MGQGLTRTGVVTAVHGKIALVVTKQEPECESCSAKESCSTLGGSGSNREVRARNTARAQVGDVVKISIQGSAFLKATFLVYMVPILALIAGAVLGYFLSKFLEGNKDLFVGIFGGLGLVGSFLWVRRKGKRLSPTSEYLPEIISRQSPAKAVPPKDLSCPIH